MNIPENAMKLHNLFDGLMKMRIVSGYKCPVCGKESSESQDIFDCLYNHIYNKDNVTEIENK